LLNLAKGGSPTRWQTALPSAATRLSLQAAPSAASDAIRAVVADPSTTMRSRFIIDPKKIVRATLVYPLSTGRNFVEILRVIDSLQLCDAEGVVTPANWTVDQQVLRKPGRKRNGAY
jgi:alkyl hydroperoxide reductase subunit AhpC